MKQLFRHIHAKLAFVVLACIILLPNGCAIQKYEGFAVYLIRGDISPAQMPALDHVDIADQPIFGLSDIITYNAQTHELKLTQSAFKRISQLDVPTSGRSFVACVDKNPVYWGAFWTPVSSQSFDGVAIWKPYKLSAPYIVTLELGYPSSFSYGGEDPRNSPEILNSFAQAGKLITRLSMAAVSELPQSMKGYELYSWSQDSKWHFTLITGTDRNKTLEEIVSDEDFISESGWLEVHLEGIEKIKTVLDKLPQNEQVFWLANLQSNQTTPDNITIALPIAQTIDSIKEYAKTIGLNFMVQSN